MSGNWISKAETLTLRVRDFVNGRWQSERSGDLIEKYSPRDGRMLYQFGAGGAMAVDAAVAAARDSFDDGRWSRISAQRRKDTLHRLASLIDDHREELALLECLDVGKPINGALNFDIPASV